MLPNVKVRSHCIKGGVNLFTANFIKNIINISKTFTLISAENSYTKFAT